MAGVGRRVVLEVAHCPTGAGWQGVRAHHNYAPATTPEIARMHSHAIDHLIHEHVFLGAHHERNERRVWLVVALTLVMMVAEVAGGTMFGSLALVADGWHMSTHAAALSISALAYLFARRHARDARFAFGTGKLGDLAGFASAIMLAMVALLIGYESVTRLVHPVPIAYAQAVAVAGVGLAVNLASAWLLGDDHHHGHAHHHREYGHGHHHHHARDLNLHSAYLHVLADAATSVLAILGLLAAGLFGWTFMDPVVGLVGTGVILGWAYGLVRDTGAVLLDAVPDQGLAAAVRERLETEGDRVSDLHLWRVGPGHNAAVVSIVSDHPRPATEYKTRLASLPGLSHVTVEVERCPGVHAGMVVPSPPPST
jgi:cation diffusion facilitator family transporter